MHREGDQSGWDTFHRRELRGTRLSPRCFSMYSHTLDVIRSVRKQTQPETGYRCTVSVQGAYGDLATASQLYSGHLLCIALCMWRRIAHVLKHPELLLDAATTATATAKRLRYRSRMFAACAIAALALAKFWPGWKMLAMIPMLLLRWPRRR